jgi:hypothetical protein
MNRISLFVAVFLSLIACRVPRTLTAQEQATITNDVRQMISAIPDSLRANGLVAWIPSLHNSSEFRWEYEGKSFTYDMQVAGIHQNSSLYRSVSLVWDSVQVKPSSSTEATISANFRETVVKTSGEESTLLGSLKASLFRTPEGWKFHEGQSSGPNPTSAQ